MKATVFGGSGFLGSHVCDKLSEAGHRVKIFDCIPSKWLRKDQEMIMGDLLDEKKVLAAIEGSDVVYNFAGIADIDEALAKPLDTARYNVLGNVILLEACRKAKIKRYVFASSIYVYSKSGGFYRCSKQSAELYIETYKENFGLTYTILRYGSLYGPRADHHNAIYRFIRQAIKDKKIVYAGTPDAFREYIHVEDAAQSSVKILEPKYENQHIILTGHQPMKIKDLLTMIKEMLGTPLKIEFQGEKKRGHYEITPYNFSPRMGKKLTPPLHIDLGQGILKLIEELHKALHPELQSVGGFLVNSRK